jgi:ribosomal protein L40E
VSDRFQEVEAAFGRLKENFAEGRISQQEFIDSLKQLRIKDREGRFWMIGAQSGKWYQFDGRDWVQAKPPSLSERKAICIYCGYENDLEAETCARCGSQKSAADERALCPRCGAELAGPSASCPECGTETPKNALHGDDHPAEVPAPAAGTADLVIREFRPVSFFWFFGVLGLFAGMAFGLVVGVTSALPGLVAGLPGFFADIQGKLLGGIVFTVLGGILGFGLSGPAGFLAAAVSNGVLSLVGGLRVRAERPFGPPDDGPKT